MYEVLDETEPAPPAAAAIESIRRMRSAPSTLPLRSTNPAWLPIAVIVPIVSKKSASNNVNTSRSAATNEIRSNPPKILKSPMMSNLGVAAIASGIAGTFKFQPFGFTAPVAPLNSGPILKADSTTIARIVEVTIPIRSAPLTFLTVRPIIKNRPNAKTTTGQPTRFPLSPRVTGTGPVPVLRTKPASTSPIRAMNKPIPTEIAIFN